MTFLLKYSLPKTNRYELSCIKAQDLFLWAPKVTQEIFVNPWVQEDRHRISKSRGCGKRQWSFLVTWDLIHPHTARWILQNSHSAGYSGRGLDVGWGSPGPGGCYRPSAAPSHWCSRWRDCRSYLLFLRREEKANKEHFKCTDVATQHTCVHVYGDLCLLIFTHIRVGVCDVWLKE